MDDLCPLTLTRDESETLAERSEGNGPAMAIGVPLRGRSRMSRFDHVMALTA